LDSFVQDNDYVFVLFYSTKGRLNLDVSANFEQVAEDWKWSKVHFARIDVDKDRDMATKWVEQGMVPTKVMFRYGRPVGVSPKEFEKIRDEFGGSPVGQKYMLTKFMAVDRKATNLHYVTPLTTKKARKRFIKFHGIAVVGYFKEDGKEMRIFQEAVWEILQDFDVDNVGAGIGSVTKATATPKAVQVPSIVVYIDGEALDSDAGVCCPGARWKLQAVKQFLHQYLAPASDDGGQEHHAGHLEL
jgi:hypothetical protein